MNASRLVAFLALACCTSFPAQIQTQLPGCEANQEVRHTFEHELAANALEAMKFRDRLAHERQVLERLIAKYPREFEPYRRLIEDLRQEASGRLPSLRDPLVKRATHNPEHPVAL